jgi:hypothetical protein
MAGRIFFALLFDCEPSTARDDHGEGKGLEVDLIWKLYGELVTQIPKAGEKMISRSTSNVGKSYLRHSESGILSANIGRDVASQAPQNASLRLRP